MPVVIRNESDVDVEARSSLAVIITVLVLAAVFVLGYFAWYVPNQAASSTVIVHDQAAPAPSTTIVNPPSQTIVNPPAQTPVIVQGQPGPKGDTGPKGPKGDPPDPNGPGNIGDNPAPSTTGQ